MTTSSPDLVPRFDDDGRLIGHDGARYPRVVWPSVLERKLTFGTRYPARARRISAAFERWFSPALASEAERAELGAWVIGAAPYLGSAAIDHAGELVSRRPGLASFATREAAALAGFLDDVLDPPSVVAARRSLPAIPTHREGRTDGEPPARRRVVVFFSELGGGTRSVAEAVAELLRETDDLEPVLLDVQGDPRGRDTPFFRAFGVREAEAWNQGVNDRGDLGLNDRLRKVRTVLRQHFVPAAVEESARLVAEARAQHVISTLPGYPILAQIATDDVPLTLLHADFGVNPTLSGEGPGGAPAPLRMFDPARVTVGLSSEQPEPELDAMRASLGPRLDRLVRVLGYPVRRAFSPPSSPREIDRLRADLGVSAGERVVLLMMGRDGMGDRLIELVRRIVESPPEAAPPLHLVVVCGQAERSRAACEEALRAAGPHLRARVTGMLPASVLAGYMHLAAVGGPIRSGVVVTKAGGATTAECAETGAHMLLLRGLPWEESNRSFAIARGLGEVCPEGDFLPALVRALDEPPSPRARPIDWRARLLSHLRGPTR